MFDRLKKKLKKFAEKIESIAFERREKSAETEVEAEKTAEAGTVAEEKSSHVTAQAPPVTPVTEAEEREASTAETASATTSAASITSDTTPAATPAVTVPEVSVDRTERVAEEVKIPAGEEIEERRVEKRRKIGARLKKILRRKISIDERKLDEVLEEFEEELLESDVALPVAEEIISNVRSNLLNKEHDADEDVSEIVSNALKDALLSVFPDGFDLEEFVRTHEKPVKIVFVGVNGTGKTTTIAKVAHFLMERGFSVVLASADTYRTGAVEQLEKHAEALGGLKVIKHRYGADPAAVVYDAIKYAEARNKDVVLADTAGRMHTNVNLMEQLRKICRVTKPDLVIFVDEAVAGNDAVERARRFNEYVGIDASILTKTDMDAKGGAAISIAYVTSKPILFLGTGQRYEDLMPFNPENFVESLIK